MDLITYALLKNKGAGGGVTPEEMDEAIEEALSDVVSDITDLQSDISVLEPTATSSDVGKALIARTVADGKVTEYEFGETGGGSIETANAILLSNGWSNNEQTVNVTGVTALNTVIVSPDPTSIDDYINAGIACTAQASGTLTFECATVPSNAITVNIVIVG